MVLVLLDPDRAADRAAGANARVPPHEPDPLLVEKILVGQGPDGAEVDHVARKLVVQREAGHDVDFFVGAAVGDHQFGRAADFACRNARSGEHITQRSMNKLTSPRSRLRLVKGMTSVRRLAWP